MGLWPFGRSKADVETASRVVVLRARDAVPMRAKVTLRFEQPQTQAIADEVAESCSEVVRSLVREAPTASAVVGFEQAIATEVLARLPRDASLVRSIEIAGLHIVGDPGHLARPAGAPGVFPTWFQPTAPTSATPTSSDRSGDRATPAQQGGLRGLDRLTPIHPLPAAGVPGADRMTPVQPVPAARPPRDPFAATAVSPSPHAKPAPGAAPPPAANPPGVQIVPARPATGQGASNPAGAPDAAGAAGQAAAAQVAAAQAAPGQVTAAQAAAQASAFHAAPTVPTMPRPSESAAPAQPIAAPAQPIAAPAQPVAAPAQPVAAPAQPVAAPAQPVAALTQPVAALAQPLAAPAQAIAPSPIASSASASGDERAPSTKQPAAGGAFLSSGLFSEPTPAPPATRSRDPFAATAVSGAPPDAASPDAQARARISSTPPLRPGLRSSASSDRFAAVRPPDESSSPSRRFSHLGPPSAGRNLRSGDEPSASSRNYAHLGPSSTNRNLRSGDEPSASSRNYAHLGPPTSRGVRSGDEPSAPSRSYAHLGPSSTNRNLRSGDEPSASSRSYAHLGPPTSRGVRSGDEPSAPSRSYAHVTPPPGPRSSSPPSSTTRGSNRPPPPAAVAARRRVVASRLPLPTGAGPYEVARGLTPLFRDTAGRILVAFLRTYDLTVVRRVPYEFVEGDILSSLTAPSDGAPGTYIASHAVEIHRWREAFGAPKLDQLQREANLAAAALAHEMLTLEGVPASMTSAVIEGLAGSAFGDPDMLLDLGRYLFPAHDATSTETLANMIAIAGEGMPPGLEMALEPLFMSLREEVAAAALLAKEVMLTPS